MSKCPNCNTAIPFFKFMKLNKRKSGLDCPNCTKWIYTDVNQMIPVSMIVAGGGALLGNMMFSQLREGNKNWSLFLIPIVILVIAGPIYLYKTTKLQVGVKPKKHIQEDIKIELETRLGPGKDDMKEYFKHKFRMKSKEQLQKVLNDSGFVPEAKEAAKELLVENGSQHIK